MFFGFSPFLGLHTMLALGVAFVFNLNRVAVLVGVYSNLPWIIAAWYALTTAAGAWLLGTQLPPGFGEPARAAVQPVAVPARSSGAPWPREMRPLFWPYFVGSLIGAGAAGRHRVLADASGSSRRATATAQEARRKAKH